MAYRTLSLTATGYEISLEDLSNFLAVDLENNVFDRSNQPLDDYAPVEACMCLLTLDEETGVLNFAHYTVKEYLVSSRIGTGPANFFQMTDDSIYCVAASSFIFYMIYGSYDNESVPSMFLAVINWREAIRNIKSQRIRNSLSSLIIQLFNPTSPHLSKWQRETEMDHNRGMFPIWSAEPGAECCITLAYLCWYGLVEAAAVFLDLRTEPFPFDKTLNWISHPSFDVNEEHLTAGMNCSDSIEKELLKRLKSSVTGQEIVTVLQVAAMSPRQVSVRWTVHKLLFNCCCRKGQISICVPQQDCAS